MTRKTPTSPILVHSCGAEVFSVIEGYAHLLDCPDDEYKLKRLTSPRQVPPEPPRQLGSPLNPWHRRAGYDPDSLVRRLD